MSLPDVPARRRRGMEVQRELADGSRPAAVRLLVLSSFNLDLLPPFVAEALDRRALAADVACGPFGQIAQELLGGDDDRDLLVVPAAEDLFDAAAPDADALVAARLDELAAGVSAALERRPGATVYVVAFPATRLGNAHVLDPADPRRGQRALSAFADGVRSLGALSPRVVVVDWDWAVRAEGWAQLVDDRLWYMGRMRLNPAGLASLADLVGRHVAAYHGRARKVCVTDLDGTLWGGIVGEVGVQGIDVGEEQVGLAFADYQRELLRLKEAGTVLAIASKNDRDLVEEAFERHPDMVVKRSDFAADRINWTDKATNVRELADELDLGLDAFVFLDDNPVERDWVRQALPEVLVPELPADPSHRPAFLRALGVFDRVAITEADTKRAASYAANATRRRLSSTLSFEDFLRSLEQEVTIEAVDETTLARAAQLCQRTNQFNLTTRRHTLADLEAMLAGGEHELYTLAVRDRFGDSGVTGLAILALHDGGEAEIDTFLLSCRVLGRRVEDALLAFLTGRAAERGAARVVGVRIPTERNGLTKDFYAGRGFAAAGETTYHLDLGDGGLPLPEEMTIKVRTSAESHS